jgi:predicted nuclease of predicted toxin-antitoxin system
MNLLFDENLSPRLTRLLIQTFPGCRHARDCGLLGRPDSEVWDYAKFHGCIIVSKDSDFHHRSLLYGPPPKIVWLRTGNGSTDQLASLLVENEPPIRALVDDPHLASLVLS